jgi:Na+-driven multidrug efflux pump
MNDRAQSIGIIAFFLSLIVGAILIFIVNTVTEPVLSRSSNATTNATLSQGTQYLQTGVDVLPLAFLLIGFFGLLVIAIYQREIGR